MDASQPTPNPDNPSVRAIISLVFGILGVLFIAPCVGPIVAIIVGSGEPGGVARAGVILGWIALGLYALISALVLALFLIGGVAALPFHAG